MKVIGLSNIMQVIMDNAHLCKAMDAIIEDGHDHIL
jgi:hypothetical protein